MSASKPADWQDEEDGVWEAPVVPNPACEASGCGKWTQATMRNPDYKGKWTAPLITNPAYKGVWAPRQIPNPAYFQDLAPADFAPIAGVAVEVWTTDAGIHLDNIIIGRSKAEALAFAGETFGQKAAAEARAADQEAARLRNENRQEKLAAGGAMALVEVYLADAFDFIAEHPVACVVTFLALLVSLVVACCGSSSSSSAASEAVAAEGGEEVSAPATEAAEAVSPVGLTVVANHDSSCDADAAAATGPATRAGRSGSSGPATPVAAGEEDEDAAVVSLGSGSGGKAKGKAAGGKTAAADGASASAAKRKTRKDTSN